MVHMLQMIFYVRLREIGANRCAVEIDIKTKTKPKTKYNQSLFGVEMRIYFEMERHNKRMR